jgi:hypothetical protein
VHTIIDQQTEAPKRYQCRHIFTDGHRCGSPALRAEDLCYYHHTTRKPAKQRRTRHSTFEIPLPEDRSAIQHTIGQVLQRIAANDIDPRRAGLLLYGLQIASLNLPKSQQSSHSTARGRYPNRTPDPDPIPQSQLVEEIVLDPELGPIAPRTELNEAKQYQSPVALLLKKMLEPNEEEKARAADPATRPTVIPTLQATASLQPERSEGPGPLPLRVPNRCHPRKSALSRSFRTVHRPTNTEKTTEKLTQTAGIAIVRGFREYPGHAVRETRSVEGWRKAQAN